jgi:hypothetical protein
MYIKHCNILEKYSDSNNASVTGHNYGEGHDSGREGSDKETLTGQITLRPCQVYFVGEDQHKTCDDDSNSSKTCKYEFGDGWMEIDTITKNDNTNTYSKKIYNQNETKKDIANHEETTQCFKRFDSDTDRRFLYQNNNLINYNYGGESDPDTIELNYYNDNGQTYDKGNFISMTFNNDDDASTNYNNVISSICSKKLHPPMGLNSELRFYKFILDKDNKITKIKEATFNSDLKSLNTVNIDMKKFLSANAEKISYNSLDNKFIITKDSGINSELVDIYRFKYNYLCNNEEGGVIKEFKSAKFTNEKKYIETQANNQINLDLKYNDQLIRVHPIMYKNYFDGLTSKDEIIQEINRLKINIKQTYNSDIDGNIEILETEKESYETYMSTAESNKDAFGVGLSFKDIINYTFEKRLDDSTIEHVKPFNFQNSIKTIFVTNNLPAGSYPQLYQRFTNYNTEKFSDREELYKLNYRDSGSENNQTIYRLDVSHDVICDILIVGGGGGGGNFGGGGGGGAVLFKRNLTLTSGSYNIKVGNGGAGAPTYNNGVNGTNGYDSSIEINGVEYIAKGGGGGGTRNPSPYKGNDGNIGGSGGGGSHSDTTQAYGGNTNKNIYTGWISHGNIGGNGRNGTGGGRPTHASGGGGGAGHHGEDAIQSTKDDRIFPDFGGGGDGGIGVDYSSHFGTGVGDNGWFGGGGGGSTYLLPAIPCKVGSSTNNYNCYRSGKKKLTPEEWRHGRNGYGSSYNGNSDNIKGKGGGGDAGLDTYWARWPWHRKTSGYRAKNGMDGTGGGGGGAPTSGSQQGYGSGGNGGSGIVLIKVKSFSGSSSGISAHIIDSANQASQCALDNLFQKSPQQQSTKSLECFTNFQIDSGETKYGVCGGFVFLEKNIAYSDFNITVTNYPLVVYDLKTNIRSVDGNILLDTTNNIGISSFIPQESGFYNLTCKFVTKNVNTATISYNINIGCKVNNSYFNLKDYIYINQLWPDDWNNLQLTDLNKVKALNNYFKDMKYTNNTMESVGPLVINYLNTQQNDYFNFHYWNNKIEDIRNQINEEYKLNDTPTCESSNAYNNRNYANFTQKCDELKLLNNFKIDFESAMSTTNLDHLFRGKNFNDPNFVNEISINDTFTSLDKNISDYITYEKKSDPRDRTQKEIDGDYYNYFEDEDTERSIYVKAS